MKRGLIRLLTSIRGKPVVTPVTIIAELIAAGVATTALAWFNVQDLSTMWQDSKGQAAAAVDQPVGLIIDSARGAALTTLATWDFSSSTGVTLATGATVSGGKLVCANVTSAAGLGVSTAPSTGRLYRVTCTISNYTAGTVTPTIGGVGGTARSSNGTFVDYIAVTTALTALKLNTAGFSGSIDDLVIQEFAGFYMTATGTGRPTLRLTPSGAYKLEFDGVDDVMSGPTNAPTYGPILTASSNYILVALSKTSISANPFFSAASTSLVYHRIAGAAAQRVLAATRTAVTGVSTLTTGTSVVNDSQPVVVDSQLTSVLDLAVNASKIVMSVAREDHGLCYFIFGSSSHTFDCYGSFAAVYELNEVQRRGIRKYFAALVGAVW